MKWLPVLSSNSILKTDNQTKLGGEGSCLLSESALFPGLALLTLEKYSQVLGCSCSPCSATTESARTLLCTRNFERVPWLLSFIFLTDVCGARTVRTKCSSNLELISYLHSPLNHHRRDAEARAQRGSAIVRGNGESYHSLGLLYSSQIYLFMNERALVLPSYACVPPCFLCLESCPSWRF